MMKELGNTIKERRKALSITQRELAVNNTKISIRFFNDREVRAIWDRKENSEAVSITTQLKLPAPDGK